MANNNMTIDKALSWAYDYARPWSVRLADEVKSLRKKRDDLTANDCICGEKEHTRACETRGLRKDLKESRAEAFKEAAKIVEGHEHANHKAWNGDKEGADEAGDCDYCRELIEIKKELISVVEESKI